MGNRIQTDNNMNKTNAEEPFGKFISHKKRLGYWPNESYPLNCYVGDVDWEDMFRWVAEYCDQCHFNERNKMIEVLKGLIQIQSEGTDEHGEPNAKLTDILEAWENARQLFIELKKPNLNRIINPKN